MCRAISIYINHPLANVYKKLHFYFVVHFSHNIQNALALLHFNFGSRLSHHRKKSSCFPAKKVLLKGHDVAMSMRKWAFFSFHSAKAREREPFFTPFTGCYWNRLWLSTAPKQRFDENTIAHISFFCCYDHSYLA